MNNVLRDTLELALAKDDGFAARFYHNLFGAHPELKPMFHRSSPGAQQTADAMSACGFPAVVDGRVIRISVPLP